MVIFIIVVGIIEEPTLSYKKNTRQTFERTDTESQTLRQAVSHLVAAWAEVRNIISVRQPASQSVIHSYI